MAKFVNRITVVDLNGEAAPERIYKSKKKKRKVSGWLKPFERHDRRVADAMSAFGGEMSRRHRKSNRKRRNGWLRPSRVCAWSRRCPRTCRRATSCWRRTRRASPPAWPGSSASA